MRLQKGALWRPRTRKPRVQIGSAETIDEFELSALLPEVIMSTSLVPSIIISPLYSHNPDKRLYSSGPELLLSMKGRLFTNLQPHKRSGSITASRPHQAIKKPKYAHLRSQER